MKNVDIECLIDSINNFVKERDWEKHHTLRNLATSISIESAELLEHFQWDDLSYSEIKNNPEKLEDITQEISDIMIYCLRLVHKLDLDFEEIISNKIEKNKIKYPLVD